MLAHSWYVCSHSTGNKYRKWRRARGSDIFFSCHETLVFHISSFEWVIAFQRSCLFSFFLFCHMLIAVLYQESVYCFLEKPELRILKCEKLINARWWFLPWVSCQKTHSWQNTKQRPPKVLPVGWQVCCLQLTFVFCSHF